MSRDEIVVGGRWVRPQQDCPPGMNVSVEIQTGSRRVIDFVLSPSPFLEYQDEALRER